MFRVNITYQSNVYWTAHHCNSWRMKDQLDVTCYFFFFLLLMCKTNTTQNQPHQISHIQRTENKTTDVVIQQHSRRLLKMDILMSETCWAHNNWNKTASGIKLVFHSSTLHYIYTYQTVFSKEIRTPYVKSEPVSPSPWLWLNRLTEIYKTEHISYFK